MQDRHQVTGLDRSKLSGVPFELLRADLLDPALEHQILDAVRPEAIIHCAAMADPDACELDPDGTHRINTDLPGELADYCFRRGIRFLHLSTDSVFDGTQDGIYTEKDAPNPLTVYSRSKFDAEGSVLSANPLAIIARV